MKKVNPNCPVSGCKAKADPVVAALIHNFSDLAKVAHWTCASTAELGKAMADDVAAGRRFALITRTRQQEELYIRALYAMFIATPDEVAHIMSDATPNSFSVMYRKVNQLIFGGKGLLEVQQPGLNSGAFTAMCTINSGAHASFSGTTICRSAHSTRLSGKRRIRSWWLPSAAPSAASNRDRGSLDHGAIGFAKNPKYFEAYTNGQYFDHISVYCSYLDHIGKLFAAGKDKAAVLAELKELHLPKQFVASMQQAAGREKKKAAPEQK